MAVSGPVVVSSGEASRLLLYARIWSAGRQIRVAGLSAGGSPFYSKGVGDAVVRDPGVDAYIVSGS